MGLGLSNPTHLLLVAVVLLMLFGAKRLPEMGRSLGAGMRGFKESLSGLAPADPAAEPVATLPVTTDPAPDA